MSRFLGASCTITKALARASGSRDREWRSLKWTYDNKGHKRAYENKHVHRDDMVGKVARDVFVWWMTPDRQDGREAEDYVEE
jgi:hypothetical protein